MKFDAYKYQKRSPNIFTQFKLYLSTITNKYSTFTKKSAENDNLSAGF